MIAKYVRLTSRCFGEYVCAVWKGARDKKYKHVHRAKDWKIYLKIVEYL